MAFSNEYIPEADYEKHDLRRICEEHNLAHRGHRHSNHWTIDRAEDIFLIKVWSHLEAIFDGWAFCWKVPWIFFEIRPVELKQNVSENHCWIRYEIKDLSLPEALLEFKEEVIADLNQALAAYCGAGVFASCTRGTTTIDFI